MSPPFQGGRIEITTKPGAAAFHGALFYIDSEGAFNATDPFSTVATPAAKRRFGFELGGPVRKNKSDFFLALEKRNIDEFNVVNALTLDDQGQQTSLNQAVSAPQRLWIASARAEAQVSATDTAALSFSVNTNTLGNEGVGGLILPAAGASQTLSESDLRFTNTAILSPNLLHETRVGYTWKRNLMVPNSLTPSLQVSGYFTGGGSLAQGLNDRERDLEIDDDLLISRGRHNLTFGVQSLGIFIQDFDPYTFNGAYVFGGGSAPALNAQNQATGQNEYITPLEQYRRYQLSLPGGTATTYQQTVGSPGVPLTQWRAAWYGQDTIRLSPTFTLATGLRYAVQTDPSTFSNFAPRAGLSWAPGRKQSWIYHVRAGLFNEPVNATYATEAARLNGIRQQQTLVYNPVYSSPLVPGPNSIAVTALQRFAAHFEQLNAVQLQAAVEHDFPHQWHAHGSFTWGGDWGVYRTRNTNAPLVSSQVGLPPDPLQALSAPRPLGGSSNVYQYQNSGHLTGDVLFLGVDQHSYRRFGFTVGYLHLNFKTDSPSNAGLPQSSYTDLGEASRPDWDQTNRVFAFGNAALPLGIVLAVQFDSESGLPYNIITGTDANGDGTFNDRPAYASTPGDGVYSTPFGLMTSNTTNGNVPRNLGTMPWTTHLDANLRRAFVLEKTKSGASRTLAFNARSANLLNHTNATAVGTVVSASNLGQAVAAEAARRLELGARFSF